MEEQFQAAADFVASSVAGGSKAFDDTATKLRLYGLYKQATAGPCSTSRPGFWDMGGRAKWDAWSKLSSMPQEAAMQGYVQLVEQVQPDWEEQHGAGSRGQKGAGAGLGPVFSTMAADTGEEELEGDACCALHALAGANDEAGVQAQLEAGTAPDQRDQQGCTPLHFCADRGSEAAARQLLAAGAQVNAQDDDGQTPLHYAALCGREQLAILLLKSGADPAITDSSGQTARDLAPSRWTCLHACP